MKTNVCELKKAQRKPDECLDAESCCFVFLRQEQKTLETSKQKQD